MINKLKKLIKINYSNIQLRFQFSNINIPSLCQGNIKFLHQSISRKEFTQNHKIDQNQSISDYKKEEKFLENFSIDLNFQKIFSDEITEEFHKHMMKQYFKSVNENKFLLKREPTPFKKLMNRVTQLDEILYIFQKIIKEKPTRPPHVGVIGMPGSGKTELLKNLVFYKPIHSFLIDKKILPIYITFNQNMPYKEKIEKDDPDLMLNSRLLFSFLSSVITDEINFPDFLITISKRIQYFSPHKMEKYLLGISNMKGILFLTDEVSKIKPNEKVHSFMATIGSSLDENKNSLSIMTNLLQEQVIKLETSSNRLIQETRLSPLTEILELLFGDTNNKEYEYSLVHCLKNYDNLKLAVFNASSTPRICLKFLNLLEEKTDSLEEINKSHNQIYDLLELANEELINEMGLLEYDFYFQSVECILDKKINERLKLEDDIQTNNPKDLKRVKHAFDARIFVAKSKNYRFAINLFALEYMIKKYKIKINQKCIPADYLLAILLEDFKPEDKDPEKSNSCNLFENLILNLDIFIRLFDYHKKLQVELEESDDTSRKAFTYNRFFFTETEKEKFSEVADEKIKLYSNYNLSLNYINQSYSEKENKYCLLDCIEDFDLNKLAKGGTLFKNITGGKAYDGICIDYSAEKVNRAMVTFHQQKYSTKEIGNVSYFSHEKIKDCFDMITDEKKGVFHKHKERILQTIQKINKEITEIDYRIIFTTVKKVDKDLKKRLAVEFPKMLIISLDQLIDRFEGVLDLKLQFLQKKLILDSYAENYRNRN